MRALSRSARWIALACATLPACGAAPESGPRPRAIDRFVERSGRLACEPRPDPSGSGWVAEDLVATSDSTFLVVYPFDRKIGHYRTDLSPDFVLSFHRDGPLGVGEARSATLVGDSLVFVADRARSRIKIFGRDGRDRGVRALDFPPYVIRSGPSGVFVGAFAFGAPGEDLIHVLGPDGAKALPTPSARYDDLRVGALANLVEVTPLADGTVIAAHQLILSRAFVIDPRREDEPVVETTVPVPDAERQRVGKVPRDLFEDERRIDDAAVPVLGATPDLEAGGYLYLTRSGRDLPDGGREKAIVRASRDLGYEASWLLDVNAQKVVYLARSRSLLVIDDDERWFECPLG